MLLVHQNLNLISILYWGRSLRATRISIAAWTLVWIHLDIFHSIFLVFRSIILETELLRVVTFRGHGMIDHVDVEVPIWLDLKWALSSPNRVSLLVCIWSLSITPTLVSRWTFDWLLLRWSGIYWLVVSLLIMLLFLHCLSLSIWSSFFCHKIVFLDYHIQLNE